MFCVCKIENRDRRPEAASSSLWEHWEDEDGNRKIDSCTIITTRANQVVVEPHGRMPMMIVINGQDDFDLWLDRSVEDPERLLALLEQVSSNDLEIYPVRLGVNSPANDSEEVVRRVG